MNYSQEQLQTILDTDGPKAVKAIAIEMGIKPAHLGKIIIGQITLAQKLSQVEADARQFVESLGLNLMEKGNLKTVVDSDGEYITHAFQWGQLVLNLQAWQEIQETNVSQSVDKEVVEVKKEVESKEEVEKRLKLECDMKRVRLGTSRSAYMIRSWQHENPAISVGDHGDNGESLLVKYVRAQLKDGRTVKIGEFRQCNESRVTADYGRVVEHCPATDEGMEYAVKMMLRFKGLTITDLAEVPFDSKLYLGF